MVPLFMFHGHRRGLATYLQAASMSPTSPFPSSRPRHGLRPGSGEMAD
jgi:hypothetical protein